MAKTGQELKQKLLSAKAQGEKQFFFVDDEGVERLFFLTKYGVEWIQAASLADIKRVSPR